MHLMCREVYPLQLFKQYFKNLGYYFSVQEEIKEWDHNLERKCFGLSNDLPLDLVT